MKFLKGFVLVILSIILFISTFSILLLFPIKHTISKDTIKDIIVDLNIENIIEDNPEIQKEINNLFEPIYDEAKKYGIDEEIIIKLLNTNEVKELMGNFTGNVIDYLITGKNQKIISPTDIEHLVNDAIDDINKSGYYSFSKEEKQGILTSLKGYIEEYQDLIPDASVIGDNLTPEIDKEIKIVRFILGNKLITYLSIAMILSILGILGLNFKKAKWLKDVAITVLIASLFSTIITICLIFLGKLILEDNQLILTILSKPLNFSLYLSISIFVLMIFILIIRSILLKKQEPLKA